MAALWPVLCVQAAIAGEETPAGWYRGGQTALKAARDRTPDTGHARNIILFIGDGMGISTVTAARIFAGQEQGRPGEEHVLSFENFSHVALIKTYTTDQQVADSAGTMTAIMTGVKTRAGVLSVDQGVVPGDCASGKGRDLKTLLEEFEEQGRASGIVTTARVTHATPAATYAHSVHRDWESDADMPGGRIHKDCRDIASQLIDLRAGDGVDVILGGGRVNFLPEDRADPEYPARTGRRRDGRDLIAEWQGRNRGGAYVWNAPQFAQVSPGDHARLLGLFEPSHMQYEADRAADPAGEPSLAEMTEKAIELLARYPGGYFLMVEGGRIDHAHHWGNAYRALTDTVAFADAVTRALELTRGEETLILVTADHSHVFVLGGYPTRGNPILGKVVENDEGGVAQPTPARAADGLPYTTLGYFNGPGFDNVTEPYQQRGAHAGRQDLTQVDTRRTGFFQEALVPLDSETHGGEDVPAYATGPWAHLVQGVQEQNYLYHVMRHAAGLEAREK